MPKDAIESLLVMNPLTKQGCKPQNSEVFHCVSIGIDAHGIDPEQPGICAMPQMFQCASEVWSNGQRVAVTFNIHRILMLPPHIGESLEFQRTFLELAYAQTAR